ncbi:MAG: hypothetical protein RI932_942, partial [Pseudomonadota bacterium]
MFIPQDKNMKIMLDSLRAMAIFALVFGCTGKSKVQLPEDAPEVQAQNLPNSQTPNSGAQQNAVLHSAASAATPSANTVAAPASGSTEGTAKGVTNTTAHPEMSTRVSGQVNSGKQGQASFRAAGHISKTTAQVGEKVKRGQVIATLDDTDAQLRLKLAVNQREQARITLEQARKDMQREEQLKKEGATTQANLERMNNALASAQIGFAQAEINLQQAQKFLADTRLTAAFDGVVSRRLKVEGEFVAVGAAVFEVASMSELEVSLRVPENLIKRVRPGHV